MLMRMPPKYNVSEIVEYLKKVLSWYLIDTQTENTSMAIEIFDKILSGSELNNEELTSAAGGSSAYGNKEVLTEGLKLPTGF